VFVPADPPQARGTSDEGRRAWFSRAMFEQMIGEGLITDDSTLAAYALLLISER
jgi:hypothetical protein